ncbi:MAG: acetate--CoA ligase family protein, partial [Ardenticatenaceae bacterium]
DMIASATPEQYQRTIETIMASDDIDALIVIYIPIGVANNQAVEAAIQAGVTNSRGGGATNKPVMLCWMAGDVHKAPLALNDLNHGDQNDDQNEHEHEDKHKNEPQKARQAGMPVPIYAYPEAAGRVLSKMAAYAAWREQPAGMYLDFEQIEPEVARQLCQQALQTRGAGWLTTEEARAVLAAFGLPISPGGVARSADDAVKLAKQVGFPVAIKLASTKIVHKTEIEGVQLNLQDEHAVRNAFEHIRKQVERTLEEDGSSGTSLEEVMEGVLVQPMITSGTEVMIGVSQEARFGSLIAFGLGGIHVEILRDVHFALTPLTDRDAKEMIRGIRGYRLLQGYRGLPAADIPALEDALLRISRLVEEVPQIKELDLNPIFALPKGCRIVDARIWVAEP